MIRSVWLQDFDALLGKTVYINKATGLSTYDTPPSEGFQTACIQDITTMAVNVVSENGKRGGGCKDGMRKTVLGA